MNPVLDEINQNGMMESIRNSPIGKAWQMAQATQNPKEVLFNALLKSNNSGSIIQLLKKNNWDEEKTFYEYAKSQGVDGDQFLKALVSSLGLK